MAKRSVLDILINVVKSGNGDDAAVKALAEVKSSVTSLMGVFGAMAGAAFALNKAFDATGGEFVRYAKDVRGFMQSFGMQAEEASRLIQVMDDLMISQEALSKSLKKMAQNGIQPSIEGLKQLSERYRAISDPAQQAKFLVDQFGKSGLEMAAAMRLGADGIQQMADSTQRGLVLTQANIDAARAYEIELDQLNDQWKEIKLSVGSVVVPALNDLLVTMRANQMAANEISQKYGVLAGHERELTELANRYRKSLEEQRQAQIDAEMSLEALADDTGTASSATRELEAAQRALAAGLAGEFSNALESAAKKSSELQTEYNDLVKRMEEIQESGIRMQEMDEFNAVSKAIESNVQAQRDLASSTEQAINKIIYQKVALHLTTEAALDFARQLGLISEKDYALQKGIDLLTEKYDTNKDGIVGATESLEQYLADVASISGMIAQLPDEVVVDVIVNYISTGTPPPSGGTQSQSVPGGGMTPGSGGTGSPHPTAEGGVFFAAQVRQIAEAGPEAVIPLKGGAVPVRIIGWDGARQGTNINVTLGSDVDAGFFLQRLMNMTGG